VSETDDSTEKNQTMTIPTKPSRNAENVFIFRVLFQRSFIDDADAVGGME
jgi:hypothetical protein